MKKVPFWSIIVASLFLPLLLGVVCWWQIGLRPVDPANKEKSKFVIEKGQKINAIIFGLKEQGLIQDSLRFKILLSTSGLSTKIQAGNFYLSAAMSSQEILQALIKGGNDQRLTMVEGLRHEQIWELLVSQDFVIDRLVWEQAIKKENLEGKLFPDTYFLTKGITLEEIMAIMARNFQKKVIIGLEEELQKSNLSLDQILTFASIVERESRGETDRRLVAGILRKRLDKDWPLQADATVQYAVGSRKCEREAGSGKCDWWPQRLTTKDLEIVSLYNTYKHLGLPPGPICNPGFSAIAAVLSPQDSAYWFYLSDTEGVMHYAKTNAEQVANIRQYLR